MTGSPLLNQRAIFGGTFDPVHRGHLVAAEEVRDALGIEDFRFLPAGEPPHREGTHADAGQRLAMLRLALVEREGFSIDERELRRAGPSWMSDTLASLRREYPADALLLVLGQDALNGLDRWHEWRRIPKLAHLVVMTRPGEHPDYGEALARELASRRVDDPAALRERPAGRLLSLAVTPLAISSTAIRESIGDPAALRRLLPRSVADHIEREGLYRRAVAARDADL